MQFVSKNKKPMQDMLASALEFASQNKTEIAWHLLLMPT